jgi:methyltransferase (TIGR00027 family)
MALYRAMESARPRGRRLFSDPFAIHFLRPLLRRAADLCRLSCFAAAVAWYADRRAPGARTSAIARTRLIDDLVCQAVADGLHQVVILGAGFDCRLYRLVGIDNVAGFEVDHPATLATKLSRLRKLIRELPNNVRYVEIDFERQKLAAVLELNGFDRAQPSVFVWEGVTNYLSAEAVDAMLSYITGCAAGTQVIFTYVHRDALGACSKFPDAARIVRNVAEFGEPWTFGLVPEKLPSYLGERGLQMERDENATQYRRRYFGMAAQSMSGYEFYHVAVARVTRGIQDEAGLTA